MTAYVIAEMTVLDPAAMAAYRSAAVPAVASHGGRFVARGGEVDQVEGERPGGEGVVLIAFPSMADARSWYASPAYAEALAVKDTAMRRRVTFVAGTDDS